MTEKRFTYEQETLAKVNVFDSDEEFICCTLSVWADQLVDKLNALHEEKEDLVTKKEDAEYELVHLKEKYEELLDENEQLKEIPIKLDNRIEKLQEDLQKLSEIDTTDLNQQAVEDVATVIVMSLNALMEFRKELKGDVEWPNLIIMHVMD